MNFKSEYYYEWSNLEGKGFQSIEMQGGFIWQ